MPKMTQYKIIIWIIFLLLFTFVGWKSIEMQTRINKLEERQELIKIAVEEHLNGYFDW